MMKVPAVIKKTVLRIKDFILSHKILLVCTLIGCVGGIGGLLAGLVTGIFVQLVANRILEEKRIRRTVESGGSGENIPEPFSGALYLCALAVYSSGDVETAALQAKRSFGKEYEADWQTLCRVAGKPGEINGDFVTECLAARLLKVRDNNALLKSVFAFLQALERQWDDNRQGEKPSVYLARIIGYSCTSGEVAAAYADLGLSENAGLDEVKTAHRRLAARYHPDSEDGDRTLFEKVQKSYEIIMQKR